MKSHPTIGCVIHELRLEQAKTEHSLIRLKNGEVHIPQVNRLRKRKVDNIRNMVSRYSSYGSIIDFLDCMTINLGDDLIKS